MEIRQLPLTKSVATWREKKPRVLFLDIEVSTNLAHVWGKWEQDVIAFESEWYILCYSAKWLGGRVFSKALPDFKTYKRDKKNDRFLVKTLQKLLDEADVIIAHNGDYFDLKKIHSRFAYHNLKPPSPYKTVDTLKVARKYFSFNSNKLGDLGTLLGVGQKEKTGGPDLWIDCMKGNVAAWKKMVKYNKQDVELLSKIYFRLLPWMSKHPNMGMYQKDLTCDKCGSKELQSRGFEFFKKQRSKRIQCMSCGGWMHVKA